MIEYILFGAGYAFAAAIQPGPLQAFLVARVTAVGWRRTLSASLAPLISDGPIAMLAILVLERLPVWSQHVLQAAGGLLLVYLAWTTFRQWRHPTASAAGQVAPRTLVEAVLVNVLNPNPYLSWTLVLGPTVVAAWTRHPSFGVALVAAFYITMVTTLAGFILAVGTVGLLGSRVQRALVVASAGVLAALGLWLLAAAVWRLSAL